MYSIAEAIDKLASLGSPDQIALEMEAQGITAKLWCPRTCVVAEYLLLNTSATNVLIGTFSGCDSADEIEIPFPQNVMKFIANFDNGNYPNLVREEA